MGNHLSLQLLIGSQARVIREPPLAIQVLQGKAASHCQPLLGQLFFILADLMANGYVMVSSCFELVQKLALTRHSHGVNTPVPPSRQTTLSNRDKDLGWCSLQHCCVILLLPI